VPGTPILMVQSPTEHKQGMGRSGGPQFTCTTTIRVVGRLSGRGADENAVTMALLAALGVLQRQVEVAVINDYDLRRAIQQYASVTITSGVSRDGEAWTGELVMDFALEFYQGPEDFAPIDGDVILELAVFADLVNVFSPLGVFNDTPFPDVATSPARQSGPDGRAEASFTLPLQPMALDFELDVNAGLIPGI
jgi:hypothetical protein